MRIFPLAIFTLVAVQSVQGDSNVGQDMFKQRIVGGDKVNSSTKYPYMVTWGGNCGGSLIAPDLVLTAAHCDVPTDKILFGGLSFLDREAFTQAKIKERILHPMYDYRLFDFDFQLLRLEEKVNVTKFPVVELDNGESDLSGGRDVVTMGWGRTSDGGDFSDDLLEVELDIVSSKECKKAYENEDQEGITPRMLCASRENNDSCDGDSGGPLIDKETGVQIALVSNGVGCGDPDYPGVYAKVASVIGWIKKYMIGDPIDDSCVKCKDFLASGIKRCKKACNGDKQCKKSCNIYFGGKGVGKGKFGGKSCNLSTQAACEEAGYCQ